MICRRFNFEASYEQFNILQITLSILNYTGFKFYSTFFHRDKCLLLLYFFKNTF